MGQYETYSATAEDSYQCRVKQNEEPLQGRRVSGEQGYLSGILLLESERKGEGESMANGQLGVQIQLERSKEKRARGILMGALQKIHEASSHINTGENVTEDNAVVIAQSIRQQLRRKKEGIRDRLLTFGEDKQRAALQTQIDTISQQIQVIESSLQTISDIELHGDRLRNLIHFRTIFANILFSAQEEEVDITKNVAHYQERGILSEENVAMIMEARRSPDNNLLQIDFQTLGYPDHITQIIQQRSQQQETLPLEEARIRYQETKKAYEDEWNTCQGIDKKKWDTLSFQFITAGIELWEANMYAQEQIFTLAWQGLFANRRALSERAEFRPAVERLLEEQITYFHKSYDAYFQILEEHHLILDPQHEGYQERYQEKEGRKGEQERGNLPPGFIAGPKIQQMIADIPAQYRPALFRASNDRGARRAIEKSETLASREMQNQASLMGNEAGKSLDTINGGLEENFSVLTRGIDEIVIRTEGIISFSVQKMIEGLLSFIPELNEEEAAEWLVDTMGISSGIERMSIDDIKNAFESGGKAAFQKFRNHAALLGNRDRSPLYTSLQKLRDAKRPKERVQYQEEINEHMDRLYELWKEAQQEYEKLVTNMALQLIDRIHYAEMNDPDKIIRFLTELFQVIAFTAIGMDIHRITTRIIRSNERRVMQKRKMMKKKKSKTPSHIKKYPITRGIVAGFAGLEALRTAGYLQDSVQVNSPKAKAILGAQAGISTGILATDLWALLSKGKNVARFGGPIGAVVSTVGEAGLAGLESYLQESLAPEDIQGNTDTILHKIVMITEVNWGDFVRSWKGTEITQETKGFMRQIRFIALLRNEMSLMKEKYSKDGNIPKNFWEWRLHYIKEKTKNTFLPADFFEGKNLLEESEYFALRQWNNVLENEDTGILPISDPQAQNITAKMREEREREKARQIPSSMMLAGLFEMATELGYDGSVEEKDLQEFFSEDMATIYGVYWNGDRWNISTFGPDAFLPSDAKFWKNESQYEIFLERMKESGSNMISVKEAGEGVVESARKIAVGGDREWNRRASKRAEVLIAAFEKGKEKYEKSREQQEINRNIILQKIKQSALSEIRMERSALPTPFLLNNDHIYFLSNEGMFPVSTDKENWRILSEFEKKKLLRELNQKWEQLQGNVSKDAA